MSGLGSTVNGKVENECWFMPFVKKCMKSLLLIDTITARAWLMDETLRQYNYAVLLLLNSSQKLKSRTRVSRFSKCLFANKWCIVSREVKNIGQKESDCFSFTDSGGFLTVTNSHRSVIITADDLKPWIHSSLNWAALPVTFNHTHTHRTC